MFLRRKALIIPALVFMLLSLSVTGWAQYRHKKLFADRFIHEPVGTEDCTVCHDMHAPESSGEPGAGQLRESIPGLCFGCHEDPASGKGHVHIPVKNGKCLSCHYPHASSIKGLVKKAAPRLCTACHKGKAGGRHDEKQYGDNCTQCHDPHASESASLLKGGLEGDCGSCHRKVTTGEHRHSAMEENGCEECHNPHSSSPVPTLPCLECHSDLLRGAAVHEPVEEGCDTCHFSHSGPYPMQLSQGLPDLCTECHEEMKAGVHGKTVVGQDCARCHDPHSSDGQALLTDSVRRGLCASCHVDIVLKEIPHTPVDTNRCKRCHDPHSQTPVATSLCRDCHGGIMDGRYDHEAAVDSCTNCHDAHGGSVANNLLFEIPELCTECHEGIEKGRHGNVILSENCSECHDPHSALQPKLLTMLKEKAGCTTCHRPQSEGVVVHTPVRSGSCDRCHEPHTDPPVATAKCTDCHAAVTEGRFVHDALHEGCDTCHDTHTSELASLLSSGIPDICLDCHDDKTAGKHGKTVLSDDCGTCHEPHTSMNKGLLKVLGDQSCTSCHTERESGGYVHSALEEFECEHCHDPHADPPVMPPMACQSCHPDMADRSTSHGGPSRGRCLECHDPHSAESAASVSIQGEESGSGREGCMECHRGVARKLELNRTVHSPARDDECTICHTNHSGEAPFTKLTFRKTKYVPFDPASHELCFSCHPSSLVQVKYTETDTGFRQGRWNLHNLHVVRDGEKGFSCWICHDAHASDQAHLVKRELPLNRIYSLKVEFRKLENGGECRTNCHTIKEYLR